MDIYKGVCEICNCKMVPTQKPTQLCPEHTNDRESLLQQAGRAAPVTLSDGSKQSLKDWLEGAEKDPTRKAAFLENLKQFTIELLSCTFIVWPGFWELQLTSMELHSKKSDDRDHRTMRKDCSAGDWHQYDCFVLAPQGSKASEKRKAQAAIWLHQVEEERNWRKERWNQSSDMVASCRKVTVTVAVDVTVTVRSQNLQK